MVDFVFMIIPRKKPLCNRTAAATLRDLEAGKGTRDLGLDDASYIPRVSYDALYLELPDGYLYLAPIVNWGKYQAENGRLMMPVTVRMNHAVTDVFRLLEREMAAFVWDRAGT